MTKTFDKSCHDLASSFLCDSFGSPTDEQKSELAARIQLTIEDFIAELEAIEDGKAGYDPRNDPLDHDYSMNS